MTRKTYEGPHMDPTSDVPEISDGLGGFVYAPELLRDVTIHASDGSKYALKLWDTEHRDHWGKSVLRYDFRPEGAERALFRGEDYACAPGTAVDSDEAILSLLTFLTLRPGDTDAGYFDSYTPEQREWSESSACETLACDRAIAEDTWVEGVDPDDFIIERP